MKQVWHWLGMAGYPLGWGVLGAHLLSSDLSWQPLWDVAYSPLLAGIFVIGHAEWQARRTNRRTSREQANA